MIRENFSISLEDNIFFDIADREGVISGNELGEKYNISRIAVFKHIKKIKGFGINIISTKKGYKYIADKNLSKLEVQYMLKNEKVDLQVFYDIVDSTNNSAKKIDTKNDFVFIAPYQTKGRGRLEREFVATEGGVYMTLGYSPQNLNISDSLKLVLLTGLAVCEELKNLNLDAKIKWPNDVYISGKKVCGILLESVLSLEKVERIYIGIGINVLNSIPQHLLDIVTTLNLEGIEVSRAQLIVNVLKRLTVMLQEYEKSKFNFFLDRYLKLSCTIGNVVKANLDGKEVHALAVGLSEEGYLNLSIDGEIKQMIVGDIFNLDKK